VSAAAHQEFSAYPALLPPVVVHLSVLPEHDCSYLPQRAARMRAFVVHRLSPELYDRFMDAGFRRSGLMIYQPVCSGCRACEPVRVSVSEFVPSKSHRRVWRRNGDVVVTVGEPVLTEEKFSLYDRYLRQWHGGEPTPRESLEQFLYESPVQTLEFCYRNQAGRLLAVGICDVSSQVLSSVYFYFEPAEAKRGLGTLGVLGELQWARQRRLRYYYLGYYIESCPSMQYKSSFHPCELLGTDGVWRRRC
jgi:leucyl-tRNA---protein transferase